MSGLLPAADLSTWRRFGYLEEARLVVLGVEIDTVSDLAEQRAAQSIVCHSVAQVHHRVDFAPVLAVFPDLNGSAANLVSKFNQLRIVWIAAIAQEYFVVLRNQLRL